MPDDSFEQDKIPDDARTFRSHAGESIKDARNWPGIILIGLGLAALGLTLTAAGGGFEGWSVIGGVVTGVCFVVGVALIVLEHRRVKQLRGERLSRPEGH